MSAPPPIHTPTARALLAWLDERIRSLDTDEAHTAERGALSAYRTVRRELVDRLGYVEQDAVVMTNPGFSHPDAGRLLTDHDEGGGETTRAA